VFFIGRMFIEMVRSPTGIQKLDPDDLQQCAPKPLWLWVLSGCAVAWAVFAIVADHWAHVFGILPYLLLLRVHSCIFFTRTIAATSIPVLGIVGCRPRHQAAS
jgi:hypothetical protein